MVYLALCSAPFLGMAVSIACALLLYGYFLAFSFFGLGYLIFMRPVLVMVGILGKNTWRDAWKDFSFHILKVWNNIICGLLAGMFVSSLALPIIAIMGLPILLLEMNAQALMEKVRKGELKISFAK